MSQIGEVDVSAGHLEIHAVNQGAFLQPDVAGGSPASLAHTPFKFVKPVDKATPVLQQALSNQEVINGVFKFFRTNSVSNIVEHYFTVEPHQARISGIRMRSPNNLDPASSTYPLMEEVSITFGLMTLRHEIAQTEWTVQANP